MVSSSRTCLFTLRKDGLWGPFCRISDSLMPKVSQPTWTQCGFSMFLGFVNPIILSNIHTDSCCFPLTFILLLSLIRVCDSTQNFKILRPSLIYYFSFLNILSHPLFCSYSLKKYSFWAGFFSKILFSHPLQGQKVSTLMGLSAAFLNSGWIPCSVYICALQGNPEPRSWILLLLFAFDMRRFSAWWLLDSRTHYQGKDQFVSCPAWWGYTAAIGTKRAILSDSIRELLPRD